MGISSESFMSVRTTHEAEIAWWWVNERVYDWDYHIKINDAMRKKAKELEVKYEVTDDTTYCCQWEGILLFGDDKAKVEAAGRDLVRQLARFKGVIPLDAELRRN